jgi:hypothetical protein
VDKFKILEGALRDAFFFFAIAKRAEAGKGEFASGMTFMESINYLFNIILIIGNCNLSISFPFSPAIHQKK